MDSTTIKMMAQAAANTANAAKMHADSIQRAINDRAEYIIFRHDLVLFSMAAIPSLALVVAVVIYVRGRK